LLVEKGYDPEYGVRFLRREIQSSLEDPLSEFLLGKVFHDAKGIKVDVKQKEFEFMPVKIKSKQKPPPSKKSKKGKRSVKPIDS